MRTVGRSTLIRRKSIDRADRLILSRRLALHPAVANAQHHNGGIAVDSDWQTCVPGLYACGECAGTFGMYRPGGSALNSTQVGSMRAAEHIARVSKRTAAQTSAPFAAPLLPCGDVPALTAHAQAQMTLHAAFLRDSDGMRAWQDEIGSILQNSAPAQESDEFLVRRLRLRG